MCLCSRVASGRVVRSPGLVKWFSCGQQSAALESPLLLSLALNKTNNADDIQGMFDTY